MRLAWRSLIIAVFSVAAGAAIAGPLEEAAAAFQRGEYGAAWQYLRPLTEQGSLQSLAEQGNAVAQTALGFMYENGKGVSQDYPEAAKWYRLAANQGAAGAQNALGAIYDNGHHGVPQDYAEAVKWMRKAADQGLAQAQNNLGSMYFAGHGVPQDYIQAHMWFNLAASRFIASDTWGLNSAKEEREAVAAKMTFEQIAEAQRLAREWNPK